MKPKPTSHRSRNTFRFQGFQQKIKNIKVSSRDFILQKTETDDEAVTYFWQTVLKWRELNLTAEFKEFQKEIGKECQSVAQLLLKEKRIAQTIEIFLPKVDILAQPPILHALVAFARDIPGIFYENYFFSFMSLLISLLDTRSHEAIENIFVSIVSLIMLLQKYIKNDIFTLYIDYEFCSLFTKKYPWYINELAAQSICSLIRKLPNKKDFFIVALRKLSNDDCETEGIGRMLFHCLKSDVARRLHSSASNTLSVVLNILKDEEAPLEKSVGAISCCFKFLASHVTAFNPNIPPDWQKSWNEDSHLVLPKLYEQLELFHENENLSSKDILLLNSYLQLVLAFLQCKQGALVTNERELLQKVIDATKQVTNDEVGSTFVDIAASIFTSSPSSKSPEFFKYALSNIFAAKFSHNIMFDFVNQTLRSDSFTEEILPYALMYICQVSVTHHDAHFQQSLINCIGTVIITMKKQLRTGDDMAHLKTYHLDFSRVMLDRKLYPNYSPLAVSDIFYSVLSKGLEMDLTNLDDIMLSCLCLPHIIPLDARKCVPQLLQIIDKVFKKLEGNHEKLIKEWTPEPQSPRKKKKLKLTHSHCPVFDFNIKVDDNIRSKKLLFAVNVIVEALYLFLPLKEFVATVKDTKLMTVVKENFQYRENGHLLRALDIYLTAASMEMNPLICEDTLQTLYAILAPCLASQQHCVRLLITHIFSLFPVDLTVPTEETLEQRSMFCIMFETEILSVSPQDYKNRLRVMSQLESDHIYPHKPLSKVYEQAPLLFYIGQLYINFKEIWPPVINSIAKYAYSLHETEFWPVWLPRLKIASFMAFQVLCANTSAADDKFSENPVIQVMLEIYLSHPCVSHLSERIDHLNFRELLWKCMHQFSDICERKNKDVVSLFFEFLYKEIFPADCNVAPTQDISVHNTVAAEMDDETRSEDGADVMNEDDCNDVEMSYTIESENSVPESSDRVHKAPTKSLCEMMILFSKFQNPKAIYRAQELENMYYEFLSHPYQKAQNIALDAIIAYNHKYLNPYKDNLYKILDDKTFKDEITLFRIDREGDSETRILKEEHRAQFMPVLMRILYGKMQHKSGSHSSGKMKAGARKGIITRFLAGAYETELDTFLNLSFDVFLHYLEGSALDIVERVKNNLNPQKVVPLKRMLGALGTLESVFEKIGGLLDSKKTFILKVTVFILSTAVFLLERKDEVCSHFFALLKRLKQLALQKIVMFFTDYEHYEWSQDELEAVFRSAVWPSLSQLPNEGIYSPTALLRLFVCWSENPRYHPLLARHHHEDINLTPMPYIMMLINHHKCSASVVDAIYNMIEKLLMKQDSMEKDSWSNEEFSELPMADIAPVEKGALSHGQRGLSFSESLVLFVVEDLLQNMKNKLLNISKGQMVNNRDLTILIRISGWIKEKELGQDLLDLIVPLLKKNCIKQNEKVAYLLDTCSCLLRTVENPEHYIRDFLFMFTVINGRIARSSLAMTVDAVAAQNSKFHTLAIWCTDLNAWNLKMVEEIDYEIRLKCYREIGEYLSSINEIDELPIMFLIYQNMWILNEVEDQGLRNLSCLCLQKVIEMIAQKQSSNPHLSKKIIEQCLLPLLKMGIRSKTEIVRNVSINILCTAVHKCHTFITKLEDLYKISSISDPDIDFLTNMTHIQRNRRSRAMNRLADQMCETTTVNSLSFHTETITEFILPIISSFLFKEEYSTDDNLLHASVRCLGSLAKLLPWYPYQNLLRYYLNVFNKEIKHLRLGVKVLESIMDAFHEPCNLEVSTADTEKDKELTAQMDKECPEEIVKGTTDEMSHITKSLRVYTTLTKALIPQIQKALSQKSAREKEHKVNKKKYADDEDIKRIPLALALIKLLKKLPRNIMELHANGVLMKLVGYLKSKTLSIRREARIILLKVMQELGGDYLSYLVDDLNSILTRGYQSHVMVFTVHAVLSELQERMLPCHIDPCLSDIIEICIEDLFGDKAEEKEVTKITAKVTEAQAEKGYAIMGIVAQTTSVSNLEKILMPLKDILKTHNKKVVNKVGRCLQKIANGLARNENIEIEHKSVFAYGILTDKICEITKCNNDNKNEADQSSNKERRPHDSFLLLPEPRKVGLIPKASQKTTSHTLIEFALNLLNILLKQSHFAPSDKKHCGLLDSFMPVICSCLSSEYPQVSIYALNILCCIIKFPLPSLQLYISKICGEIFVILNKFASSGLTKGKLFELVQLCFKSVAGIIKDIQSYNLEPDHIRVLLHYARNNLEDHHQHHSTFTILEAIISRRVITVELHDLMVVIREWSVMSSNINMLDQARSIYFKYMLNYPKNKKQHISALLFFLSNISFGVSQGRMSASLMVNDILSKYPRYLFDKSIEVNIWFKLAEQLVKEQLPEHRLLLKKSLKDLYRRSLRKKLLISNCLKLMEDNPGMGKAENAVIIHMSAQSLLAFLDNPADDQPSIMLSKVVPKVVALLHPGRYQLINEQNENLKGKDLVSLDVTLDSLLGVMAKLMDIYLTKGTIDKWAAAAGEDFWEYIQEHLLYPNLKVRLRSAALYGKLFALYPAEGENTPIVANSSLQVKSLIMDFCEQLNTESPVETGMLSELGMAVVRNLIYLIWQGKKVPISLNDEKHSFSDGENKDMEASSGSYENVSKGAYAVLHKVGTMAYDELKKKGKEATLRRESLLNLIAGVIQLFGNELQSLSKIVSFIMKHLTRELSDEHLPELLATRTKEVAVFMRDRLGTEMYNEEMLRVKTVLEKKRNERKARNKERIISNPQIAMEMKAKKQIAKKNSKKRKLIELKVKPSKKRRLRDLAMVAS